MIDDERNPYRTDEIAELNQPGWIEVQLDMPVEFGRSVDHTARDRQVWGASEMAEEVQANSTHACPRHLSELGFVFVSVQQRDAPVSAFAPDQGIDHRPVVGAVAGRLHDHRPVDAKGAMQSREVFLGNVLGAVTPVRDVLKTV